MKPKWVLAIIGTALIIGGIAGAVTRDFAAWVGATVFSFAFIFALTFYLINRKKRSPREDGVAETMVHEEEAVFQGSVIDERDPIQRDSMIKAYIDRFHISRDKAENLFDAGYCEWSDFSEAIPEDLVMIEGINPTVARGIVSSLRSGPGQ
ncbi:MAG: helix-hairpin-helix domain-containing protein [Candidatus Thermoplasmatota archaeon]|nr:helix-hairpin-helix domain-containing protein [Candidatus Thermoplasmatota archaeon]